MSEMVRGLINDRWPLMMTPDRVAFHAARPLWEAGRLASCAERMTPGMVVYDVGAECGDFTALYGDWVGVRGTVVPFEPKPEMWPSIKAHWEANHLEISVEWWPGFASDQTGSLEDDDALTDAGWPADLWPTYANGPVTPDPGFRHLRDGNAPQIRLDDFAAITDLSPDALVIDVEGAEYRVLEGCTGLFAHSRPLVWVSVHDIVGDEGWCSLHDWYGRTADDLHVLMAGFDYAATELPAYGEAERFFLYEPT